VPSEKNLEHKHANEAAERDCALYVVSAGGRFVGEGEVDLTAYALTLRDVQAKVVDCRRTAASKDIESGIGIQSGRGDSHKPVTFPGLLRSPIISFFLHRPRPRNLSVR
jgi:hypothetical protein